MNVWKFGTRWNERGAAGTSILKTVFIPRQIAFAHTDKCLQIREGDLLAFADGYDVIAIGKAMSPGARLTNFEMTDVQESENQYFSDPGCVGCRVKIFLLDSGDVFQYPKAGMFYNATSKAEEIKALYNKYSAPYLDKPSELNLFHWANKELAQDSFLCWLASYVKSTASERIEPLKRLSFDFLRRLCEKVGVTLDSADTINVQVYKQIHHIDLIVCIYIGNSKTKIALLIEDKVCAEFYNDINSYKKSVANDSSFKDYTIYPILIRTQDGSDLNNNTTDIKTFKREDFLNFFKENLDVVLRSEIVNDFYFHIKAVEDDVQSYRTQPIKSWSWNAWKGFYSRLLSDGIPFGCWCYVANASGGFLCLTKATQARENVNGHPLFLQIENAPEPKLCLKLGEVYDRQSNIRNAVLNAFSEFLKGQTTDIVMERPSRLGCGCYMTLLVASQDKWLGNINEVINLGYVEQQIRKVILLLENFFKSEQEKGLAVALATFAKR